MKLIPEWRRAWRFASVQVGVLAMIWVTLPADTQAVLLQAMGLDESSLPAVLGALVIVARLVAQPSARA